MSSIPIQARLPGDKKFCLFALNDHVIYRGKTYVYSDLDRLCMVVENENNLAALETL